MKLLILIITLVSASAFARPNIGDYAEFDVKIKEKGGTKYRGISTTYLESYESQKKRFGRLFLLSVNGGDYNKAQLDYVTSEELMPEEKVNEILKNCAASGGRLEKIKVKAGKFDTCKMKLSESDEARCYAWIGQVPFGVVQMGTTLATGTEMIFKLTQFRLGKSSNDVGVTP